MNRILKPNNGEEIVSIAKGNSYAFVTDYGAKFFLKEIKVSLGQHTWEWVSLTPSNVVDLSEIGSRYCSFDNAINKKVNDPYCTVYLFETEGEMAAAWNGETIKYEDSIKTVYKSEKGK